LQPGYAQTLPFGDVRIFFVIITPQQVNQAEKAEKFVVFVRGIKIFFLYVINIL
jgi:hypothetical protein